MTRNIKYCIYIPLFDVCEDGDPKKVSHLQYSFKCV